MEQQLVNLLAELENDYGYSLLISPEGMMIAPHGYIAPSERERMARDYPLLSFNDQGTNIEISMN